MSIDTEETKKGFKPKKKQAYKNALDIYIQTDFDAKKIAEIVDVSENTISTWISSQNWLEIKGGIELAPYTIERNLLRAAAKASSKDKVDADEMVKFASAIEKFKVDKTSLVNALEVFHRFNDFLMQSDDKEAISFLLVFQDYQDKFIKSYGALQNQK